MIRRIVKISFWVTTAIWDSKTQVEIYTDLFNADTEMCGFVTKLKPSLWGTAWVTTA